MDIINLKGNPWAYGKSFFQGRIYVMNKNKMIKKIYSTFSHHNSNKSIVMTCIAKYGYVTILASTLYLPLWKELPSSG